METCNDGLPRTTEEPPRAARFAVALLFFINGALFASWVSRIPAVQVSRGLSHAALGLGLLGMAGGALMAMPFSGWLSHRFGSASVSKVAATIYAGALPLLALAPDLASFMAALVLFGAAHGSLDVSMNAQAIEVEERYPKPIMSSFHALFSLGGLVGAVSGGVIAAAGVNPNTHFLAAAIVLAALAVMLVFPRLFRSVRPCRSASLNHSTAKRRWSFPPRALLALGLLAFCVMLGEGAMADWSGIFLRQESKASEAIAAVGYAAFSIAMAAGRLFGDALSARFGPVQLVRFGGALSTAGLATALIAPHPIVALCCFAAVGAGFATIVPQVFTAAGRVPGTSAGPALAVVSTTGYFGFLLGPPAIGLAAEWFGLTPALGLVVLTSAFLAVFAGSVASKTSSTAAKSIRSRSEAIEAETHFA